ncbi:hypothetical protein [Thermoflexus hugenholtzii]|uniref:Uncharacterized protein n=1 Tax=Thermoflexus hugenholtzii JAD2 TaxID=877466 RepID=A0A212QWG0_9CHLR|nr:hypothetical protein [Thermoflexus hugenholtzii]SNB64080.1 hypothetical protein SAMN02746019_00007730 [Thermoflexus hugenholtzii JAD2]
MGAVIEVQELRKIYSVGLISVPIGMAARREAKVLRRFQATPLPPAVYLTTQLAITWW